MKKIIGILLAFVLLLSVVPTVFAADDDVLMIYDAERHTDVGGAYLGALSYEYFTQGMASYGCSSVDGFLEFFMDSFTYNGNYIDITGYDYIEFDLMSWEAFVCDFNFAVIPNLLAHHGNDFYMEELYLPAGEFVHFKIPIKDLVVYSQQNMEPYDYWRQFETDEGWEVDELHYGGSCLNAVARLRWQFAFARVADPYEEPFEDVNDRMYPEFMEIYFDNVVVTKNGAGSDSTVESWADVKQALLEQDQNNQPDPPVDPDVPDVTPSDLDLGDVNGDDKIDAKDALLVLRISVNKYDATEGEAVAADVNKDAVINAKDALEILKHSVGKPSVLDAKAR